jgi:hypothetical protein
VEKILINRQTLTLTLTDSSEFLLLLRRAGGIPVSMHSKAVALQIRIDTILEALEKLPPATVVYEAKQHPITLQLSDEFGALINSMKEKK